MEPYSERQSHSIKKIPPVLEGLCQKADLIIGVGANQKICFKTNGYVSKTNWLGWLQRRFYGEDTTDLLQRVKQLRDQLFEQYSMYADRQLCDLILVKLLDLREACLRLRDTTYDDHVSMFIGFNSIVRAIDVALPEDVRQRQGITSIGANLYASNPYLVPGYTTQPSAPEEGLLTCSEK